jgi:cephalosporin-C deacetylase-like acetyl esterase
MRPAPRHLSIATIGLVIGMAASAALQQPAPPAPDARQQLIGYLNGVATAHLDERQKTVERISTRSAALARQKQVRQKLIEAIGGLPDRQDRVVAVKTFGSIQADGFRVEKIAYESLPGFWVTANVYVPATGTGRYPAVVVAPGHGAGGKNENWSWGGNFARSGIIALAYDPIGQGERAQYLDRDKNASYVGNPTGEHGMANIPPMLIGETLARYMVNDGMRGIDYLLARPDVDGGRIGAFGCSGGGTSTAYLAALDDRVTAAATACYITSFRELLVSATGVQEAEQSLPRFLSNGLDFADWVEAAAPRPYAIVSTEDDMFPFAGARQTYEEARRIYGLYGAEDRLQWITGPGGHGDLGPISPQILSFFARHLKADGNAAFAPLRLQDRNQIVVTTTGQVGSSLGGEDVASIVRERARTLMPEQAVVENRRALDALRQRVRKDVQALTGTTVQRGPSGPPVSRLIEQRPAYRLDLVGIGSDGDTVVTGILATPSAPVRHRATLLMTGRPRDELTAVGGEVDRLARGGSVVLALEPRPTPPGTESIKSPYLGSFNLLSLRAFLVGKTVIGLRVDDAMRAVNWLSALNGVSNEIAIRGDGQHGLIALHAAVLDERFTSVDVRGSLASYRMILEQPGHRNVSEYMIPGVLLRYDVGDLLLATWPRPVQMTNPIDATGAPLGEAQLRKALAYVFESEAILKSPGAAVPRLKLSIESSQTPSRP